MDLSQIRLVVDSLASAAVSEARLKFGEIDLHVRFKQSHGVNASAVEVAGSAAGDPEKGLIEVKAPMPGIVYLSPSPDAPPFITKGASIAAGQTLMLIEAMKSMLPLRAAEASIVEEILVENECTVGSQQTVVKLRAIAA